MNPIKTCMYDSFNQGLDEPYKNMLCMIVLIKAWMNSIKTCMYVCFNQGLDEPYKNMYVCVLSPGLLDPKWMEERQRAMAEKQDQEEVLAPGSDIDASLKQLAERRTDIFGIGTEETQIGKKVSGRM